MTERTRIIVIRSGGKLAFGLGLIGIAVIGSTGAIVGGQAPDRFATSRPVSPAAAVPRVRGLAPAPEAIIAAVPTPPPAPVDDSLVIKRVLKIDGLFEHGDYVWDEEGAPAGPLVITADIAAQTISVFRGGYEIGAAVILYGAYDKPTPTGVFPIKEKDADHVSNLYDAPMPYMLRLTDDGVAIHGSGVEWNRATHGCIGVPIPFAKLLFDAASLGDRVIVTDGKRLKVGDSVSAV